MTEEVNVIGVGYIGSVISLHLAKNGLHVKGVDIDENVLEKKSWFTNFNDISDHIDQQHLESIDTTINYSDITGKTSIICVNTPVDGDDVDLRNIRSAMTDLGKTLEKGDIVVTRSTVPPGTNSSELIPILEEVSGLERGEDFYYCYAPEFLRGGTGLKDLENPSKTVVAGDRKGVEKFKQLFPLAENVFETDLETAEAVKIFDNAFHGLKISLANECGRLGKESGFNPNTVMEIISSDSKLNISSKYLSAGNHYGGPCLLKDIQILETQAKKKEVDAPVISSINQSNDRHGAWLVDKIKQKESSKVGLVGATYKADFNSLVNSPCLDVASRLEENGFSTVIYEPMIEIEEHEQTELEGLKDADTLIIFNQFDEVDEMKEGFEGDIIDLSSFSFE